MKQLNGLIFKKEISTRLKIFFAVFIALFTLVCSPTVNAQWQMDTSGLGYTSAFSLAYSGNNIFAGTFNTGVFVSSNNGASWVQTSLNNQYVISLAVSGNNIFAGTYGNGVFVSTDTGTTWTQTSLNSQYVPSLAVNGTNIFAGVYYNGVYLSSDTGKTWTQTTLNSGDVYSLVTSDTKVFAGKYLNGVYLSSDTGKTWTQTSLNNQTIKSLLVNGSDIFAGTYYSAGIYISTNGGTSWAQILPSISINSLTASGNNIFAGSEGFGVYISTNNGTSWVQRNEGWVNLPRVFSLCIFNNYIYAATDYSMFRRPLDELTDVQTISNEVPQQFSISQNYPNPFNPSTTISYQLPISGQVTLKIYDVLGDEVATLVNEEKSAGSYEVDFNAAGLSSGIYFYKIQTGSFVETKKMILMK